MTEERWSGDGLGRYVRRPGGHRPPTPRDDVVASRVQDTTPDETVAATHVRWDASRIDFGRIRPSSVDRALFRFEQSLPDLVWNAAALEGNTFTLPEVRTLLDGVTIGGKKIEEEEQVLALADGYTHIDDLVRRGSFTLTKSVSDELHGRVARHEAIESGAFRGEGSVGGVPQALLQERFQGIVDFLDSLRDPRERALGYFAAATRSQFYFDGNKRTARLMMSGVLMAAGYESVNLSLIHI